jgi:hypothetical protein
MSIVNGKLGFYDALTDVRNWKKIPYVPTEKLRAFTIRRTELEFLLMQLTITESNAARFYLGNKSDSDNPEEVQPCLIMVGVQGFVPYFEVPGLKENIPGTERYFNYFPEAVPVSPIAAGDGRPSAVPEDAPYVLDFSYPCPHTCDLNSCLMDPPPPNAVNPACF